MTRYSKTKAFTLIELLVVISIIALLVGILLPALGAARESARGVVCQTHVKNLSTAFVAYGTDHNGWWPAWSKIGTTDPLNEVVGAWVPSGGLYSPTEPYAVDLADGSLWDYTSDYGVFSCPSDPWSHLSSGLSYTTSHHIYRNIRPNFADLTSMEPAVSVSTSRGEARYPQSDKFRTPSNLIYIVDEGGPAEDANLPGGISNIGVNDGYFMNLYSDLDGGNKSSGGADKTKWYHGGGASFGFADGHGENRKQEDEEIYRYSANYRVTPTRIFEYGRIWDPAAMAPIIAGQP